MTDKYVQVSVDDRNNFFWGVFWHEERYREGTEKHAECVTRRDFDELQHEYRIIRCLGWWEAYQEFAEAQKEKKAKFSFIWKYNG